jgi:uncharacterized membrane protein
MQQTLKDQNLENKRIDDLFEKEAGQLGKLHAIVEESIRDEESILEKLLHPTDEVLTPGQSLADKVARFGGSWTFIISFLLILFAWIAYNAMASNKLIFDPYPFILMNLILSCIAALQAPVIMMSQNRQEEKDRQRAQNDYIINLKAELEVRSLHKKMDLLLEEQIVTLFAIQQKQIHLLNDIRASMNSGNGRHEKKSA